ncbi:XRE family transcriptional regulator [Nonomuraea terrae]|uniref:XRE family transcriptional regulator n=1 Tax=Nonomuraea terrae TaxID=2530383 RepID=A0A4R4YMV8_9ACTN|nr:helix-turn-helix transcriptional regulator [Nonomuraea terrae]TDD45860.1 XRE family transcriptional regulator [Nonomuraea terrae]
MKAVTLGEFLRTRRASVVPDGEVIPAARRRVPGLRREEVAQRVGMSVDYYTRLEQGRKIAPSESVLNALADVLQLDPPAREHMWDLAWGHAGPARQSGSGVQHVRPGMLRLMESFGTVPAVLTGRRMDVLAANRTARVLLTDFYALPARERNAVRWALLSEEARRSHEDWENAVAGLVGMLRMDVGRYPDDPRTAELLRELREKSAVFTRIWDNCHVATSVVRERKAIVHPVAGRISLEVEVVTFPGDRDRFLHVLFPASDPASRAAMRRLEALADV